jgi:hypothetical protein
MRGLRRLLANLALAAAALGLALGSLELALRAFPRLLPAGSYGASHYDPELLASVHGSDVVYHRVRFVEREVNAEGFLDVAHPREKPPGTLRVGFFGDSYVEAAQVPLEQVFFRRLPETLRGARLEPFGFGVSGWGTLHASLAWRVMAPRYDLDAAVYLFVENDPGDNDLEVQGLRTRRLSPKTYATLSPFPPGYELVLLNPPEQLGAGWRFAKWCQQRLVLARLLWSRATLLAQSRHRGERSDAQNREMATRARGVPDQNDLPASWPPAQRERSRELAHRILRDWASRARSEGRPLFVLYVPRGEAQLRGEIPLSDTWKPWLEAATRELGVPLLDPSDALRRRMNAGDPVYDDHWSPAGHEVVAGELARELEARLPRPAR